MTVLHYVNTLGHIIKFSCNPNYSHLIRSKNLYFTNFFPLSKSLKTILHIILLKIIVFLLPFRKQDLTVPMKYVSYEVDETKRYFTYIQLFNKGASLTFNYSTKVLHLHSIIQQRRFTYVQLFNKGASLTFSYSTNVLHLHSIIQQRYFTYIKLFSFKNICTLVT
jgi:hypothetical protein